MFKNINFWIFYFIVILLYFVTWSNTGDIPNIGIRLAYIVAILMPIFFGGKEYAAAIVTMFFTLCVYGLPNYILPSNSLFYIAVLLFAVILYRAYKQRSIIPIALVLITIQSVIVNLAQDSSNPILYPSIGFMLLALLCSEDKEKSFHLMSLAFIAISIVVSYYFIIGKAMYSVVYGTDNLEREFWMDPNYMGCVVGMGVVASLIEMFRVPRRNFLFYLPYVLVILFSLFILFQNASRGSLLSVGVCLIILLLFSKIKLKYRALSIVGVLFFLYYLYNNQYMDLLIYRIEADAGGTGSGRTIIWGTKLQAFLNDSNPLQWLFGVGYESGRSIGFANSSEFRTFHNDFLGFFVDYGLWGLLLLINVLSIPFRIFKNRQSSFVYTLAGMAFLLVVCNTLEPLTGGQFAYYAFLFYIILLSKLDDKKVESQNND